MKSAADRSLEPPWLVVARWFARVLVRSWFRLRVHGVEHLPASGPVLLAGNHQSFLDGPLVYINLPRAGAFFIKEEMYDIRWLAWFLRTVNQIAIHRGKPDRTALQQGLAVLRSGCVLGMFPEGTRGEGRMESVKDGIGYLAVQAQVPIVPVACLGSGAALPMGAKLPRLRAPIDVVLGPAFTIEVTGSPHARQTFADAAEQIRRHLVDHLARAYALTGRSAALDRQAA